MNGDCGALPQSTSAWRNHNVLLTVIVKGADGLASGIWNGATLAAYIYLITNRSNKWVGLAEGLFGTFCAVSGLLAGWYADRIRRDRTLKLCGIMMFSAIAATVTAIFLPPRQVLWEGTEFDSRLALLLAAMTVWGCAEAYTPVADAIFADSVPTGRRAGVYTLAFSAYVASSSAGQFIAAGLFWLNGNTWSLHLLARVILVGMAVALVPAVALFMFDDDKTLGDESEALLEDSCRHGLHQDPELPGGPPRKPPRSWTSKNFLLPAILLASDGLFGLAAGMTVKFFPIFFKEAVGLSPASTNTVMACIPLALTPLSFGAQRISKHFGRVQTIMSFEAVGVSLMAVMGLATSLWHRPMIIVPILITRSAANNATYAIAKSILMDYVPKESRGRWNSLDCVLAFGWSGSAACGGFLLDRYGFAVTFRITALLQGISVFMLIPLLAMVPRGERPKRQVTTGSVENCEADNAPEAAAEGVSEAAAAAAGENLLSAPLLGNAVGIRQSLERERMQEELHIGSYEAQRVRLTPE